MDQKQLIYENNKISLDLMLAKQGYAQSYAGFLKAVKELGDGFLHSVYTDLSSRWSNADGRGWAKFKNIFKKTTEVIGKVGQGANIANTLLNPPDNSDPAPDSTPQKQPWKPNIYFWGGIGLLIIVILLIIYLFKK